MRFAFIEAEKAETSVADLCRALDVSRSGFYAWKRRAPSARTRQDDKLRVLIRAAHVSSRYTYGSPRLVAELAGQGISVGSRRVARLMRCEGLVARPRRRYRSTTMSEHDQPIAANVLDREFAATQPNERWVGDTTELAAGGSRLFLAVLLDLFSRIVVGWAVSTVNDRHLALKALDMALRRRRPPSGLLHHTDQGSPYASEDYRRMLDHHAITSSMSRRGNCYDNAAMESWFSTLKSELGERFESCADAKAELFDYIEVFYNQQRRHSSLGQVSPAAFERQAQTAEAA